jgi:hypothetical protein
MSKKISLRSQKEIKRPWSEEQHTEWCTGNERNGMGWMKAGIWKLTGIRRGTDKRKLPSTFRKVGHKTHTTELSIHKKGRIELLCKTQLNMNEELACRKIINCVKRKYTKNIGEYLNIIKGKEENYVMKNNKLWIVR